MPVLQCSEISASFGASLLIMMPMNEGNLIVKVKFSRMINSRKSSQNHELLWCWSHHWHHSQLQVPSATLSCPWQIPTLGQARHIDSTIATSLFAPPLVEGCGHSQPLPCHLHWWYQQWVYQQHVYQRWAIDSGRTAYRWWAYQWQVYPVGISDSWGSVSSNMLPLVSRRLQTSQAIYFVS